MAPPHDYVQLLSTVVPAFLNLASFHISDDVDAIKTRAALSNRDPFYAKLHDELKVLAEVLVRWDRSVAVPEYVLHPILHTLEGRFISGFRRIITPTYLQYDRRSQSPSSRRYERLRLLQDRMDDTQEMNEVLEIGDIRRILRLKEPRESARKKIVDQLVDCNKALRRLDYTQNKFKFMDTSIEQRRTYAAPGSSPSTRTREDAKVLYKLLSTHWRCQGHAPHTSVRLRLATHRDVGEAVTFNMFLGVPRGLASKWQEGEARVLRTEACNPIEQPISIKNGRETSRVKTVAFQDDRANNKEMKAVHQKINEERWPVQGVCRLIRKTAQINSVRLKLLVEDGTLYHMNASITTIDDHKQDFISLGDFLASGSRFSPNPIRQNGRLILMVLLANAFLHFHGGPWASRDWSKKNIFFPTPKSCKSPNILRPYLSSQCVADDHMMGDTNQHEKGLLVHPYPNILALGILLLEIQLGRPIEGERSHDHPNRKGEFNVVSDLPEAGQMFQDCIEDTVPGFEDAVAACLDVTAFFDACPQSATLDEGELTNQVYTRVVKPLEAGLQAGTRFSVEELDTLTSTDGIWTRMVEDRRDEKDSVPLCSFAACKSGAVPLRHYLRKDCQNDGNDAIEKTESYQLNGADDWFGQLEEQVHPLLEITKGGNVYSSQHEGIFTRSENTRVAILDTGICLPESMTWKYEDRIKGCRSWLKNAVGDETEGLEKGDSDLDGHGTNAAALLLQTSPHSDLYVARIIKDRADFRNNSGTTELHQRIADAITHAVKEWAVDIIILSFGFDRCVKCIEDAIKLADSREIIVVAAASNAGGNHPIAWPARLRQVLCIFATDSFGNPCDFTPTNRRHSDNFSVLGKSVKSCWPDHLGQGSETRKSGTSTATSIAAGIAAIVLDFMRITFSTGVEKVPNHEVAIYRKLRTTAGMKSIFREMADKRANYDYIVPWKLLDAKRLKIPTVHDLILKILRENT